MVLINLNDLPEFRHDDERHNLALGAMVEVKFDNHEHEINGMCFGTKGTMRGFIVGRNRDCDGTPLYAISPKPVLIPENFLDKMKYKSLICDYLLNYPEYSLKVIKEGAVPLKQFVEYMSL